MRVHYMTILLQSEQPPAPLVLYIGSSILDFKIFFFSCCTQADHSLWSSAKAVVSLYHMVFFYVVLN